MSYKTVAQCATDNVLYSRITAAAMEEAGSTRKGTPFADKLITNPGEAVIFRWPVAAASDVEAAYAAALASDNPDPGGDEAVITDGMILANVSASWPA